MFCETGTIGEILNHGIALPQEIDNEIDYFKDTYCKIGELDTNKDLYLNECLGNQLCEIKF